VAYDVGFVGLGPPLKVRIPFSPNLVRCLPTIYDAAIYAFISCSLFEAYSSITIQSAQRGIRIIVYDQTFMTYLSTAFPADLWDQPATTNQICRSGSLIISLLFLHASTKTV
jgi:hypothetical protein